MTICIADNLRFLRCKNGYTLEALAEIISVSRQSIAKWESGDSLPDIVNCVKLATLYKISLDELVNRPLKSTEDSGFIAEGNKICGVVDLSKEGSLQLPESIMELFDIHGGDKMLLLADKNQGIALLKCSQF